ncbi:hypothetical protein [Paraburkholderia sp. RL17-373-BIF-A]|uniref:hypothetical protein n=1 Tax=Paraburkholderia sp. RL17-373-BIF-A TaxID=3031629 RepID=UPI0038BCD91F
MSNSLDHEARAELLCYLVATQLAAHACTGEWLRTDHFVESLNLWLITSGAEADWLERMQFKPLSEMVARDLHKLPHFRKVSTLAELFTDGLRLNYHSPIVLIIYEICDRKARKSI